MRRSKGVFLIISVIFFICLIIIALDFSRMTSFPGSDMEKEEIALPGDTLDNDINIME